MCGPVASHENINMELLGFRNPQAIKSLEFLVKQQNPNLLFLCETKQNEEEMNSIAKKKKN